MHNPSGYDQFSSSRRRRTLIVLSEYVVVFAPCAKENWCVSRPENGFEMGSWCKPGGAVEYGETVEDAVRREVREEFGVEIELLEPLGFTNQILPKEKEHWVAFHYLARITQGEPKNMEPDKTE